MISSIDDRSSFTSGAAAVSQATQGSLPTTSDAARLEVGAVKGSPELRQAFDDFVGQTFFGTLMAEMRKGLDGPAYFGGGRTEEVFQGQLDQVLVERIAQASSAKITEPMYNLFMMGRG